MIGLLRLFQATEDLVVINLLEVRIELAASAKRFRRRQDNTVVHKARTLWAVDRGDTGMAAARRPGERFLIASMVAKKVDPVANAVVNDDHRMVLDQG